MFCPQNVPDPIICESDKLELVIGKNILFFILNYYFFIASVFVTWQLHVHIIKIILCHLQKKVIVFAKGTELLINLHVEFKNNS